MKGDFSRDTFHREKHYCAVHLQQGRVAVDADWNEEVAIDAHLRESALTDLVGRTGAPHTGGGFQILPSPDKRDLLITPGRFYVDGILCEAETGATYLGQPDLPAHGLPTEDGAYLAYLDVWKRHLTALEDPAIREVALGGPDTATRTRVVWQVKLLRFPNDPTPHCLTDTPEWQAVIAPSSGRLSAQTSPVAPATNLCVVPSDAGYTLLENQLYRVEVHLGSNDTGGPTFKWSRDNGTVATAWLPPDAPGNRVKVASLGRDDVLGFHEGHLVELTDDARELRGEPGDLVKIADVDGETLIVDQNVTHPGDALHPRVRRWDGVLAPDALSGNGVELQNSAWIPLEGSLEIQLASGSLRSGDYWLIPARAFIGEHHGSIEWPQGSDKNPLPLLPHGVEHHYARLAVVDFRGPLFSVLSDCRRLFPAATDVLSFFPAGGDGQEAMPGAELACPLRVAVTRGRWPVAGARVKFVASSGHLDDDLDQNGVALTRESGIARCRWTMPDTYPTALPPSPLTVTATLLDVADQQLASTLRFHANLSAASLVAFDPGGCPHLAGATTVQSALDVLCANSSLSYAGGDGQEAELGQPVPQPLEVRVSNGRSPQPGASVRFAVQEGGGSVGVQERGGAVGEVEVEEAKSLTVRTNEHGLATCQWRLGNGSTGPRQQVDAMLLTGAPGSAAVPGQIVRFNATRRDRSEQPFQITGVAPYTETADAEALRIPNDELIDEPITVRRLIQGIEIACTAEPVAELFGPPARTNWPPRPNVQVILHLPHHRERQASPLGQQAPQVVGYLPLILAGSARADGKRIIWQPTAACRDWLEGQLFPPTQQASEPLLFRLILAGNFIWSKEEHYLDGDTFGALGSGTKERLGLASPGGDGRKGGDFQMWFWVTPHPRITTSVVKSVVSGVILKPSGEPMGGVSVSLTPRAGGNERTTETDREGKFWFHEVPAGTYVAMATLGELPAVWEVVVGRKPIPDEPRPLTDAMARPAPPTTPRRPARRRRPS